MNYNPEFKRLLDLFISTAALLILSPLFYFVIIFIKIDSKGPAFFRQKRIGYEFRSFELIKFRSMRYSRNVLQKGFEPGDNSRVTMVGAFLRKTKMDELPELFNVLKGDMSIVGPRPEVEKYVRVYSDDFKEILKIRPGLSDYASIRYRDEEEILSRQSDPEHYYVQVILPDKIRLAKSYLKRVSLSTDINIVKQTLSSIVGRPV